MSMKKCFFIIAMCYNVILLSQINEFKVIFSIDESIVIPENISDIRFLDFETHQKIDYDVGGLYLLDSLYQEVLKLESVRIAFRYYHPCLGIKEYTLSLGVDYLRQRYLLVNFFDFELKSNQKKFKVKTGFGYEIISPLGTYSLPRSKRFRKKCI